jgi:hypothetical protein
MDRKVCKARKAIPVPRGRREMTGRKARRVPVPMERRGHRDLKVIRVRKALPSLVRWWMA